MTTIRDTFARTVVDGWGATDTGHTWQTSGGSALDREVSGGAGRVTLHDTPGTIRVQRIGRPATDGEILTQVVAGQVSETTAMLAGLAFRYDSGNFYRVRVQFTTSGTITLDLTHGVTGVGSNVATGLSYTPGVPVWVRARVDGHRVRARVWADGAVEPTTWALDGTITTDPIAVGDMGLLVSAFSTNTNTDPSIWFKHTQITYRMLVDNRLSGDDSTLVSNTTLTDTADSGIVTIASPGTRAAYDTAMTVHELPAIRIESGHHRQGTPRLRVNLPASGPWSARWYTWMPHLQDAGFGSNEVRSMAVLPTHAWTVHATSAGNAGSRLQAPDLAATPLGWTTEGGSAVATGQWWRVEMVYTGTDLISRVYQGHSTTGGRIHTWSGLADPGRTLDLTGYRWRRRATLQWGAQGSAVAELQNELLDLGYDLGVWGADGDYGDATYNAVVAFQGDYGLSPVDGVAGPETRAAMDLALRRVPPPLWISHLAVADGQWIGPAEPVPAPVVRRARFTAGMPI